MSIFRNEIILLMFINKNYFKYGIVLVGIKFKILNKVKYENIFINNVSIVLYLYYITF